MARSGQALSARVGRATTPAPELTDREDRRTARLLIILALTLAVILSVSAVMSAFTTVFFPDPSVSLGWPGTILIATTAVLFWIAFVRSRGVGYRSGAWVSIFTIYGFLVAFILLYPDKAQSLIVALAMPVLVATIFIGVRGTVRLVGLSLALGGAATALRDLSQLEWVYSFAILLVVMALTLLVAVLLEDDLRQLDRLREAEREDAQRLRQEVTLARTVQLAMLPATLPSPSGVDLGVYCEPATEASGDFYDLFEVAGPASDERLVVVVCDVAGKGVASALVMAAARAALRSEAELEPSPGRVLQRVNHLLAASIPTDLFVTAFLGMLNPSTHELTYASGGHPHPYRWSRARSWLTELESHGLPLGLVDGADYDDVSVVLDPGDVVLVYTDGLVEAMNPRREMYGFDEARRAVAMTASDGGSAQAHVAAVVGAMDRFVQGEPKHDDVTMVAFVVLDADPRGAPVARSHGSAPAS